MNSNGGSSDNSKSKAEQVLIAPPEEYSDIRLSKPKGFAAGAKAVMVSLKQNFRLAGAKRGTRAMLGINQKLGFDCPSCAWPDPDDHRAPTEFCENGAKAIASEATKRKVGPEFFRQHSIAEISRNGDFWMEEQGRLTDPMILHEGASHYEPIGWDEAFEMIADELKALDDPNKAIFYTSGRTVNECAFLYGVFARMFGTNNLPDCSNMCHESSGAALNASIGVGKGTVSLKDIERAETLLIVGQNPGTNHPRMLSSLQAAAREGAEIIAVNPMKEAGLIGFAHPQEIRGMLGLSTPLATDFLRVNLNGDQALFQGLSKAVIDLDAVDKDFVEKHTVGYDEFVRQLQESSWEEIEKRSGIAEADIRAVAEKIVRGERKLITCWAMGLTQHRNAVPTIREVVNLHLLLGAISRPGAGLCPVRGHSNVQGDRTMGIFEKMPPEYHDAIDREFQFTSPREVGHDVVGAIRAMHAGDASVFFAMGGNFLQATPDTEYTAEALRNCSLTVHVSTKLNRSHVVTGKRGLILPCLGRSELDIDEEGEERFSTVENSMGIVHQTKGGLTPISSNLLSENAIIAKLAKAVLGENQPIDFDRAAEDYDYIRQLIERVLPGFDNFNERVREPGGFYLPNGAKELDFDTESGKAEFQGNALSSADLEGDQLMLMTIRSHDQFNTTVYGMNDRYRGISNERRVLFMNPDDMKERGIKPMAELEIENHDGGRVRRASKFLAIPYEIPRKAVAGYFPELNVLVPIDSQAEISGTPCSKSVAVTVRVAEA
ncbi:MAG: FdhF/YdeP family oxidoreductase [Verrucomicrobiota bacterium]